MKPFDLATYVSRSTKASRVPTRLRGRAARAVATLLRLAK